MYSQDITQAHVSGVLSHFKPNFMERWGFEEYNNPNKPAVFLGLYDQNDLQILANHKAFGVLHFGGADFELHQKNFVKSLPNILCVGYGWIKQGLEDYGIPCKEAIIPLQDYSKFKSVPLGENIYVYKGLHGNRPDYFKWGEIIKPLQHVFGEDRIIYTEFKSIDELYENYYKNCFVYLKPNPRGGSTSMWELGCMGRKTIAQNQGGAPNVLEYTDLNHIIELIMQESSKIGTIQDQVSTDTYNYLMNDNRWLDLNYWLKNWT